MFIKVYRHFLQDSLYRNSIYLMLSTAILALFGFIFWLIVARQYSVDQVGIATSLISVMTLISSFSILGLNIGLVRFLSQSKQKNENINSSFFITTLVSILISVIFVVGLRIFSPNLLFLQSNFLYLIFFILFVAALSVNTIIDSIFLAYRSANYTLLKNIALSIVKVSLPLFMVIFGAYGIFASVGISNIIALVLSIIILVYVFRYKPKVSFDFSVIKKIAPYSFSNYIAGFLNAIPAMTLPIIVSNKIGSKEAAYYYISMMIANFIFIVPQAISQSFFAEGSNNMNLIRKNVFKSIKMIILFVTPAILAILFLGNYILLTFGSQYSQNGLILLQLFTISSVFVSINAIYGTILKIRNMMKAYIIISIIYSISTLLLCNFLINFGLLGIGFGFILGQIVVLIAYLCRSKFIS